jgi:hypothetical protein
MLFCHIDNHPLKTEPFVEFCVVTPRIILCVGLISLRDNQFLKVVVLFVVLLKELKNILSSVALISV